MKPTTTVFHDQDSLLQAIMRIHGIERFTVDPTYSKGCFYTSGKIPEPEFKFDINPQRPGVMQADCRDLPLLDESVSSMLVDLPFIHHPGKDSMMGNRFGGFPSQKVLREVYYEALVEFERVLKPGGLLCWKVQNIVESGKQVWNSCWLWLQAVERGWYPLDKAVLIGHTQPTGFNHHKQQHLRRADSDFWLFRNA